MTDTRDVPGAETLNKVVDATRRLGEQTAFYGNALAATADAVRRYPAEVLRLIAVMGMGTGALAVIGGTVVIVGFLTLSTGALIAVQGYNTLSNVGIEALTVSLGRFSMSGSSHRRPQAWHWPRPSVPARPRSSARCASTKRSTRWR
jgi:ABC-type transporter Mla maintaining outer membrane lipid asymmetry permease subunit MlaE